MGMYWKFTRSNLDLKNIHKAYFLKISILDIKLCKKNEKRDNQMRYGDLILRTKITKFNVKVQNVIQVTTSSRSVPDGLHEQICEAFFDSMDDLKSKLDKPRPYGQPL